MTYEEQYEEETGTLAKVDISHNNTPWLVNSDAYVEWLKWIVTSNIAELDVEHRRRVAAEELLHKCRACDKQSPLTCSECIDWSAWQSIKQEAGG